MKYSISSLLVLFLLLAACDKQELTFQGPSQVRFTESDGQEVENFHDGGAENLNEPISVSVHLLSRLPTNDVNITYSVSGTAEEGVDFTIINDQDRQLTVPAGESFTSIDFNLINNAQQDGDRQIIFQIESVDNNYSISAGPNAVIGRRYIFTITDDDCLQNLKLFEGSWEVVEEAGINSEQNEYELTITPDFENNNRILIRGFGGIEEQGGAVFAYLDLCKNEFIVPEQVVDNVDGRAGNARTINKGTFNIQDGGTMSFTYTLDTFGEIEWTVNATKR
jgi:hypothetical protein